MGWTSADAAGLPIFPGLVRYDEVENAIEKDGDKATLGHAFRFTLSQAHTAKAFINAASHTADGIDGPAPFGMHVRLKADYQPPASASTEVKVIINTLKKYGMILADNGSDWFFSGSPNSGWDDDALQVLKQIKGGDFEVVDVSAAGKNSPQPTGPGGDPGPEPGRTIVGTRNADTLTGGAGNDRIVGLGGNDRLDGVGGNDKLEGRAGADRLDGGAGDDVLTGGVGLDDLRGRAGKDTFLFDVKPTTRNLDKIRDFYAKDDCVFLDDAHFKDIGRGGGLTSPKKITADAFHVGKAAADAEDRIVYDKASGALYYDRDGTGDAAAVKFAILTNKASLTVGDFFVI
jgi:hypothetical protein